MANAQSQTAGRLRLENRALLESNAPSENDLISLTAKENPWWIPKMAQNSGTENNPKIKRPMDDESESEAKPKLIPNEIKRSQTIDKTHCAKTETSPSQDVYKDFGKHASRRPLSTASLEFQEASGLGPWREDPRKKQAEAESSQSEKGDALRNSGKKKRKAVEDDKGVKPNASKAAKAATHEPEISPEHLLIADKGPSPNMHEHGVRLARPKRKRSKSLNSIRNQAQSSNNESAESELPKVARPKIKRIRITTEGGNWTARG